MAIIRDRDLIDDVNDIPIALIANLQQKNTIPERMMLVYKPSFHKGLYDEPPLPYGLRKF